MPTLTTMIAFSLAATLLIVVPGPNLIYIVTRGIERGRRAAVLSAIGVETATLVPVGAAALGLSAVIASSAVLFDIVRYAGAAYLLWLGIGAIRSRPGDLVDPAAGRLTSMHRVFAQGFLINVLNPKVALFFLAFLPQFIDPDRGSSTLQVLVLGGLMVAIGIASDMVYAFGSGAIGSWLQRHRRVARRRGVLAGVVYIGLGAVAALSGTGSGEAKR